MRAGFFFCQADALAMWSAAALQFLDDYHPPVRAGGAALLATLVDRVPPSLLLQRGLLQLYEDTLAPLLLQTDQTLLPPAHAAMRAVLAASDRFVGAETLAAAGGLGALGALPAKARARWTAQGESGRKEAWAEHRRTVLERTRERRLECLTELIREARFENRISWQRVRESVPPPKSDTPFRRFFDGIVRGAGP